MKINRRSALGVLGLGGAAAGLSGCATTSANTAGVKGAFNHGVASGDPSADGFVIWTRFTPDDGTVSDVMLGYEIAEDKSFSKIVKSGKIKSGRFRDFTAKAEIEGLKPGRRYTYRFRSANIVSPIGSAKSLPVGATAQLNIGICSCSNYQFGYFSGYADMAKRDLDLVVHLGDYIYEYSPDGYGSDEALRLGRQHVPDRETVSLEDYRLRHAQYKSDAGSIAMHGAHTLIPIWDDHEITNNPWKDGAQNHQDNEGDWEDRVNAAMQAFYEWMPVRDPKPGRRREQYYTAYEFGDLATLATVETRLLARTKQLEYDDYGDSLLTEDGRALFYSDVSDDSRELIGPLQMDFLSGTFAGSKDKGQPWRILANQIIMAKINIPNMRAAENRPEIVQLLADSPNFKKWVERSEYRLPLNLDAWDGYPAERERLYTALQNEGVSDMIVLTGDTHEFWANRLEDDKGQAMGVELGTSGITSPGTRGYLGPAGIAYSEELQSQNNSILKHENSARGYIILTLTPDNARAVFIGLETIDQPETQSEVLHSFAIKPEGASLSISREEVQTS